MTIKIKLSIVFLSVCLAVAATGCSDGGPLPPEADLLEKGPIPIESGKGLPEEPNMPDSEPQPKGYDSFAEAYVGVLLENNISQDDPIGAGSRKIAIEDVFGDETPELLYVYRYEKLFDYLSILTYSKSEGVEPLLDFNVFAAAGGGGNYCVFLTKDGELLLYCSSSDGCNEIKNRIHFLKIGRIHTFCCFRPLLQPEAAQTV